MMVLDQANTYDFPNMVVKVTDTTAIVDDTVTPTPETPKFNILIPTVQDIGTTNILEMFYPGEPNRYLKTHGTPNPLKYGFGPDFVHAILSMPDARVGVYTINLRGPSATMANIICLLKYRVEKDVPYTNTEGDQYYVDVNGQLTTSPTDATPVIRDVLHLKFITANLDSCKKWTDLQSGMNTLYSEIEDEDGYRTCPFFGIMYRGASNFGNNCYLNMTPHMAEYDGNMYYSLKVFDGATSTVTDSIYSFDRGAGVKYNTSYYIEDMFNTAFPTMRFMASETSDEIVSLINQYLFTLDDFIANKINSPSKGFAQIDIFNANEFAIVMDEGSINVRTPNAFQLYGGFDGTETRDELFESFFNREIIGDLASPLRYRMNYIPDIGYNDTTKQAILDLVKKRSRMTNVTLMIGGTDTFSSALLDHQANYHEDNPNLRQIAKIQSPMMYNEFIRRTVMYPASYFDMVGLLESFARNGNYYQPYAGFNARWTRFIEDTMVYPTETTDFINSLQTNRINFVMKDSYDGAYLNDQLMNTTLTSDQTELNNEFLISNMLYDLLDLVHRNHFKFNEAEQVRMFNEAVNDYINTEYIQYSAMITCEVYRVGTIGRAKSANQINVRIDFLDINKFTNVNVVLYDE